MEKSLTETQKGGKFVFPHGFRKTIPLPQPHMFRHHCGREKAVRGDRVSILADGKGGEGRIWRGRGRKRKGGERRRKEWEKKEEEGVGNEGKIQSQRQQA